MAGISATTPTWEEIDRAESCLVCCMSDEAAALSSSILRRLLENYDASGMVCEVSSSYESEWDDLLDSAGMVLVQSLKQLKRTSEILDELKIIFGSLTAIPVQVFHTGACFQLSENPSGSIQAFLEDYLNNWRYDNGRYYPSLIEKSRESDEEGSCLRFSIGLDWYFEIIELYVISLLSTTGKDAAISQVEKANLPTEKRQDLLRRLRSINSCTVSSSSQTSISPQFPVEYKTNSCEALEDPQLYNGQVKDLEIDQKSNGESMTKEEILKLSRQKVPYLWWFPAINLKFGNTRFVIPSGIPIIGFLLLVLYFFTRNKRVGLKRILARKALAMKNAVLDFWNLAFSYQLNPLAAVQALPTPNR